LKTPSSLRRSMGKMSEERKEVFRFVVYSDGTFEAEAEKEKINGKLTPIHGLLGAFLILMASVAQAKGIPWNPEDLTPKKSRRVVK
jgi:hypothetical protein